MSTKKKNNNNNKNSQPPKPVGQVKNLNTTTKGIFEYKVGKKKED